MQTVAHNTKSFIDFIQREALQYLVCNYVMFYAFSVHNNLGIFPYNYWHKIDPLVKSYI